MSTSSAGGDPLGWPRRFIRGRGIERRGRTFMKTAGYRVVMVLITIVIAAVFTDNMSQAVNIGIAANAIKTVTYYAYERFWAQIAWGVHAT